jgi:hypothetical protein
MTKAFVLHVFIVILFTANHFFLLLRSKILELIIPRAAQFYNDIFYTLTYNEIIAKWEAEYLHYFTPKENTEIKYKK